MQSCKMPGQKIHLQRVESDHDELAKDVHDIFQNLDLYKRRRIQEDTTEQLAIIHERVKKALAHYGISTNIHTTPSEIALEEIRRRRPPGFNTKQKREEMLHKRTILDIIHEFGQTCCRREMLIDEFSDWLFDVQTTVEKIIVSDEDMAKKNNETTCIEKNIIGAVNDHKKHIKKVIDKFKVLSKEIFETLNDLASREYEETEPRETELRESVGSATTRRQMMVTSKVKENKDPLNEKALMADAANWKAASVEVKRALDESGRMARTNNDRNMCRNALKQFNFMCIAMERRNQENSVIFQDILDCQVNINHLNKSQERIEAELKKKNSRMESMEKYTEKQNQKIAELQLKLKEMRENYEKALSSLKKSKAKEQQLVNEGAKSKDNKDKKAAEELKLCEEKMADDHANMMKEMEELYNLIKEHEDTIEKLKVVIDNLEGQLDDALEKQREYEKRLNITVQDTEAKNSRQESIREQYMQRITDYKNQVEKLEEDIRLLRKDMQAKIDMISLHELKITELTAELKKRMISATLTSPVDQAVSNSPNEHRHIVTRIKADYELEIHKLQDHLHKEKQRCDATLRKQDQDMKIQLAGIHRVSLHLLRAINHFKDSLGSIFEKEGLLDTAHEVKLLHGLQIDEKPADTKIQLNMMSGNALELLVSLEIKIAQALMNKRLELKEALAPKRGASPVHDGDVDEERERLRRENVQAYEKTNKMQEEINGLEYLISETKRIQEEKYKSLLDRHKQLILHNSGLQREMKEVQSSFRQDLKQRDSKLRSMRGNLAEQERNKQMLVMQIESNKSNAPQGIKKEKSTDWRLKVADQVHNLKMLEDALGENKISLELHTITVDIITQSMEVPEMRLRQLFERYIIFRRLQDQKEQLMKKMTLTTGDQEKNLQGFLTRMEKRMQESIKKWQEKKDELKLQRSKLYEQMFAIFEAVKEETGLSMVKPITKTLIFVKPQQRREHGRLLGVPGVHMRIPDKPSDVIGTSVTLIGTRGPVWKPIANLDEFPAYITVPRTLDMDINSRRNQAREVLKKLGMGDFSQGHQSRSSSRISQIPSVPPLASLFPPITSFKK